MILLAGLLIAFVLTFNLAVGDFSLENSVLATGLSTAFIWLFRKEVIPHPMPKNAIVFHMVLYAPVLFWYLFVDIMRGTWQVVMTTLGLRPLEHPGIVTIPLQGHSMLGVGPVGFFITLSPGSFLVEIDWEHDQMLVHVLDASHPEKVRYDAEKYFRLWEYGPYAPGIRRTDAQQEDQPHA